MVPVCEKRDFKTFATLFDAFDCGHFHKHWSVVWVEAAVVMPVAVVVTHSTDCQQHQRVGLTWTRDCVGLVLDSEVSVLMGHCINLSQPRRSIPSFFQNYNIEFNFEI